MDVDMDVDMDESKEELSFVPSAVSDSTGWHETKSRCSKQHQKEGFKFYDVASVKEEDDGEPNTNNICLKKCYFFAKSLLEDLPYNEELALLREGDSLRLQSSMVRRSIRRKT